MRLITAAFLFAFASLASAAELRELRVWGGLESTRVVLELDQATDYRKFSLANPDRLVVDLYGLDSSGAKRVSEAEPSGVVKSMRSAVQPDGALRVVLELAEAVREETFTLPGSTGDGQRLVMDLYGATPSLDELIATLDGDAAKAQPGPEVVSTQVPEPAQVARAPAQLTKVSLSEKRIIVAIDAGHGGQDPGAIGQNGLREKDVALAIARRLAKLVDQQPGMKAVLTRDSDVFIPLYERTRRARRAQADLFVSIHANAYKNHDLRGSAVYVLSANGASSEHARWLAAKENDADMVGGIELPTEDTDLATVLLDLSQDSTMQASMDVGKRMLDSLGKVNRLQRTAVQEAGFVVLKAPDIPSVLVETAFISNKTEEKLLGDPTYQERMARSLLTGIIGYFEHYRPQQPVMQTAETSPGGGRIAAGALIAPE